MYSKYLKLFSEVRPESELEVKLITHLTNEVHRFEKKHRVSESVDLYLSPLFIEDIKDKPVAEVYAGYCEWCKLNYFDPDNIKKFSSGVKRHFTVETKNTTLNNKKCVVYRKKSYF